MPEIIEVLVEAGKATAGPPIGPALGPMEINIMDVVNAIKAGDVMEEVTVIEK